MHVYPDRTGVYLQCKQQTHSYLQWRRELHSCPHCKLMQPIFSQHCTCTFSTLQVHSSSIRVSTALAMFVACKRKPLTVYFPPASLSGWGYKIGLVCLSVSPLTVEPFDIQMSSNVKIIGQRSRLPYWNTWFSGIFMDWPVSYMYMKCIQMKLVLEGLWGKNCPDGSSGFIFPF